MLPIDEMMADIANDKVATRMDARVRFEHRMVEFMLRRFGLQREIAELVRERREQFDDARLTFAAFRDRHRDFPVWLVARRVRNGFDLPFHALGDRKKAMALPAIKAYLQSDDRLPQEVVAGYEPRGLVFEWLNSGAPKGMWVVHDDRSAADAAVTVYHPAEGRLKRPLRVGIQPFATFLDRLGYGGGPSG
jgi:hypothetical protein